MLLEMQDHKGACSTKEHASRCFWFGGGWCLHTRLSQISAMHKAPICSDLLQCSSSSKQQALGSWAPLEPGFCVGWVLGELLIAHAVREEHVQGLYLLNNPPRVAPAACCVPLEAPLQDGEGRQHGAAGAAGILPWGRRVPSCSSHPAGELAKCFVVLLSNWECV